MLIIAALALMVWWLMFGRAPPTAPSAAPSAASPYALAPALPDRTLTPGAVDAAVTDDDICAQDWGEGDPPQPGGGDLSYSKAARHTSYAIKQAVFDAYHLTDPHDGGQTYEVDHLVPLALGGRDAQDNLWPESRVGKGMNAWAKDRLEYRLYVLVCNPPPGAQHIALATAQAAFRTDWVAAYQTYCADEADCPAY